MNVADVNHYLLRAARINVRVTVDNLDVHRVATNPVLGLLRPRRIGEAGDADVILGLDVGNRKMEVVLVVRIEIVGDEHVTHVQGVEPKVGAQVVQVELEYTSARPGLLRVEGDRGNTIWIDRVKTGVYIVLDVIATVLSTVSAIVPNGVGVGVVDVVPADRLVADITLSKYSSSSTRNTPRPLQHAEVGRAVSLHRVPRTGVHDDEHRHVLDLVAVEVLVRIGDGDRRRTARILVDLLIPGDRRLGVDDLHHPDGDIGRIVRVLVHPNKGVHVLKSTNQILLCPNIIGIRTNGGSIHVIHEPEVGGWISPDSAAAETDTVVRVSVIDTGPDIAVVVINIHVMSPLEVVGSTVHRHVNHMGEQVRVS